MSDKKVARSLEEAREMDRDHSLDGFPGRIYVADAKVYSYMDYKTISRAFEDIEQAVPAGEPVEVGIYQLVRTAKFQKTAVEVKTLKELKG
jgi:hypothetical protein